MAGQDRGGWGYRPPHHHWQPFVSSVGLLAMQAFGFERDSERHVMFLSICIVGHPVFKPKLIANLEQGIKPYVKKKAVPRGHQRGDKGISGSNIASGE